MKNSFITLVIYNGILEYEKAYLFNINNINLALNL